MKSRSGTLSVAIVAEASPDDPRAVGGVSGLLRALGSHLPEGWTILTPSAGDSDSRGSLGPSLYRSRLPHRILFPLRLLSHIGRLARLEPDLVYTHSNEAAMLLCLLRRSRFPDLSIVHHQHGSENPLTYATFRIGRLPGLPRLYGSILGWMHRNVDHVIAIDRRCLDSDLACGVPRDRITLLPNAIDTEVYKPSAELGSSFVESRGIPAGAFLFAFAGRLEEVKRVGLLIDAFAMLEGDPWLVIAGDGSLGTGLRRQAGACAASHRIVFTGPLDPAGMPALYAASDCLVLPSAAEGVPLVILEAMSAGVPAIATKVGGVPDLVGPENGILLEVDVSAAHLAVAMERAMARSWKVEAIRSKAAAYSAELVVSTLDGLFREVCGKRERGRKP